MSLFRRKPQPKPTEGTVLPYAGEEEMSATLCHLCGEHLRLPADLQVRGLLWCIVCANRWVSQNMPHQPHSTGAK